MYTNKDCTDSPTPTNPNLQTRGEAGTQQLAWFASEASEAIVGLLPSEVNLRSVTTAALASTLFAAEKDAR